MTRNVGISDSGMATEATNVARQSRRNAQTTSTARAAPISSASTAALKPSRENSHRVGNQRDPNVGVGRLDPGDGGGDLIGDRNLGTRAGSHHVEGHHGAAIEQRGAADLGRPVDHVGEVAETGDAAARQCDGYAARSSSHRRRRNRGCGSSARRRRSVPRPAGRLRLRSRNCALTSLAVTPRASSRSGLSGNTDLAARRRRGDRPGRRPGISSSVRATVSSTKRDRCFSLPSGRGDGVGQDRAARRPRRGSPPGRACRPAGRRGCRPPCRGCR